LQAVGASACKTPKSFEIPTLQAVKRLSTANNPLREHIPAMAGYCPLDMGASMLSYFEVFWV
jgi:hypothetical protein